MASGLSLTQRRNQITTRPRRAFFADWSTSLIKSRDRWRKAISLNTEEMRWMSLMIPIIFFAWVSKLMARMSVRLSEYILIRVMSRWTAAMSPDRRARTSATIGEETKFSVQLLWCLLAIEPPEILHARPALLEDTSQTASDLHVLVRRWFGGTRLALLPFGKFSFVVGLLAWAIIHSRARLIPLITTSFADSILSSKICRFRAVQSAQQIHGRIVREIPASGRQYADRKATGLSPTPL